MRNAFAAAITELAGQDARVVLLSGDIGNRLFDKYKEKFPDRFFNCGVSEANMTSMAAGMALSGAAAIHLHYHAVCYHARLGADSR